MGSPPDLPDGPKAPGASGDQSGAVIEDIDNISRTSTNGGVSLSGTYNSAQEYIDALNAETTWVTYDKATNTASITSIADFTAAMKNASKGLGAFDELDRGQGENEIFGVDGSSSHSDAALASILESLGADEAADYPSDLNAVDELGVTVEQRLAMYTPLYYLLESEDGFGTSTIAKFWRIRTGIAQSDTSLTTEVNLALALQNSEAVESVDFASVWGRKHTEAETIGNSKENFVLWVEECTQ